METIPTSRKTNYWRDGVRPIDQATYRAITESVEFQPAASSGTALVPEVNDLEQGLESGIEGAKKQRYVNTYERDPKLRHQAIVIHGTTCLGCGFNFGKFYGAYAEGFIHIHHSEPVSEFEGERQVNPATELVPLCANCHAVVHRRKDRTLSVEELRKLILDKAGGSV